MSQWKESYVTGWRKWRSRSTCTGDNVLMFVGWRREITKGGWKLGGGRGGEEEVYN